MMARRENHFDVIVVGAGLIGLAFALQLAKKTSLNIAVVERSVLLSPEKHQDDNQRVVALGSVATNLLEDVGVFQALGIESCYPYTKMTVWDDSSAGLLNFCAEDYQQPCLGHMVDAIALTTKLRDVAQNHDRVELIDSFQAINLQLGDDLALIESDSKSVTAQLIVAADGAQSWVRRQAKIFAEQHPYQQQGIVAKITTSESHQDTAWQIFLNSGPLAVLPLHDNQSSIVWSMDNNNDVDLLQLTNDEFSGALANVLGDRLGAVTVLSSRQAFELKSVRSEQYYQRRLALIGDAAHSIHPLAGQGANLGFKDASALVDILAACEPNQLGELAALRRYQYARKSDNERTDSMMSLLHKTYQINARWWQKARGLGMNAVSSSDILKRTLVKQAMGF